MAIDAASLPGNAWENTENDVPKPGLGTSSLPPPPVFEPLLRVQDQRQPVLAGTDDDDFRI